MQDKLLLTKKDLSQRWQVSERTIDQYREDGVITPIKGIPCVRYNLRYIQQIEECIPEKTTLRERKLEKELQEVINERDYLKSILANILAQSTKAINSKNQFI